MPPSRLATARPLHTGWRFREVDPSPIAHSDPGAWLPAEVPGHVHLDLERAGVIPDPLVRMHERTVAWVDDVGWAYECTFTLDTAAPGTRRLLRFGGVDTVARILIDGDLVAEVDNMLIAHEVTLADDLATGEHTLTVEFAPAEQTAATRRTEWLEANPESAVYKWGLLSRSFLRKAQYAWGWDWGPQLRGCGLWGPVELVEVPSARIAHWSHRYELDGSTARLTVTVPVDGDADEVVVSLGHAGRRHSATAAVVDGVATATVEVADVQRWWPAGWGDQPLYDLAVELRAGGDVVDRVEARIGFREIELIRDPDDRGERFCFRVNGRDLYAKGANWIPDDPFPARTRSERVRRLLELSVECGMNMIRIWGGGLYESEDFYDHCDELGLLVWQDFAYACAFYPDDDHHGDVAAAEATSAVRRIRHHASLALWCGNNENQWLSWMGAFGHVPRTMGDRLYDDVLPAVVAAEDPATPYWPSSPYGTVAGDVGPGDRPPDPSGDRAGDSHYWNVWHGAGDWRHYAECEARFVSEFGFAAPPDLRTLEASLAPHDLGVDTPAMRWHDKTGKGYETYLGFIGLHYPEMHTVDDLVYFGQLNQADAMTFGIEHFRRLTPHNMGTLVWQLNDCWPVQSWAWIDSALRPKAAWYRAKRFYAPLLVSPWRDGDDLVVHVVNDTPDPVSDTVSVEAVDPEGRRVWTAEQEVVAAVGTSTEALRVALPADVLDAVDRLVVRASFAGAENRLLLAEPKDLRVPSPGVRADVSGGDGHFRVRLTSDVVALSVRLTLDGLDAVWSDNFLDVHPGEERLVECRVDAAVADVDAALRIRTLGGGQRR